MRRLCLVLLWLPMAWLAPAHAQQEADQAPIIAPAEVLEKALDPAASASRAEQDELYLNALRALADGRPNEAAEMLTHLLKREPRHAGAWLDLAISQCELGNAVEAERLFQETERLFEPPASIREVIAAHRASGCKGTLVRTASWMVSAGRGHDSNVNQGPSNPLFGTGNGDIELSPDFLPQPDSYTALSLDYFKPLDNQGTLAIFQVRNRIEDHVSQQNTTTLLAGIERPWQWHNWNGRGTASIGLVRLDSELYQRQSQLQLRVTPPLQLPEHYELTFNTSISHVQYPTRPQYGANTAEFGTALNYRGAHSQAQLAAGSQADRGRDARPGGNRQGWYAGLQWYNQLNDKFTSELGVSRQLWRSDHSYSPGLIDVVRHQQTESARVALLYALQPHHALVLEWRETRNRENISLFQYNSRAFQLSWRWDNF